VWLDVGVLGFIKLFCPLDGQLFNSIYVIAATVITMVRIALGIFISEERALGLENGTAGVIFRGDEVDDFLLTLRLGLDNFIYFRVGLVQGTH
jgi:hypothetical protein